MTWPTAAAACYASLWLFVGAVNAWALLSDRTPPPRLTRLTLHLECILFEPWHAVSRIWMHAKGMFRELKP
jgi:hypothetical protein